MNIPTAHPDSAMAEQTPREITKDLARNKIRIAAFQETHITKESDCIIDNYRVIAAVSTKKGRRGVVKGGTAIATRESAQKYIT